MFNFSIKIDDEKHSLSATDGISIDALGDLLQKLYKAMDADEGAKCTMSGVRGNCYALDFTSESEQHLQRFKIVHSDIQNMNVESLEKPEKEYAKTLQKILGGRYYLNAYDENKKKIASIKQINHGLKVDYYYTHETIYGVVSMIGAKQLASRDKAIYVDGFNRRIHINKAFDQKLKEHYGEDKLELNIRVKRLVANDYIVNAEIKDFRVVGKNSLSENFNELGYVPLSKFHSANTIEQIISAIYGND